MTIVSYSEIFKYQTCQRQYYYRFIKGLSPLEESDPIVTGVKGHKLLQNFYEYLRAGHSKDVARELVEKSAKNLMKKEGIADYPLLKAWTLVDNYIRKTDFTAEAVIVENRYLLPVSALTTDPELSHVQIGFTPDVVFKRTGDWFDIEDAKFVGRAWSKSKLARFQQIKLYQIFLEHMNYNISRSIIRFFNVTTSEISIYPYTMTEAAKQILIEDFIVGVRDVIRFKESDPSLLHFAARTMNYTACGFCAFEFACTLEADGKDASRTLNSQYKKSDYDYNR